MKLIYTSLCCLFLLIAGCANQSPSASVNGSSPKPVSGAELQKQVDLVQKKMKACIFRVNQTEEAKYVDLHILAVTSRSPNTAALFNSHEKIGPEQVDALIRFKEATMPCRAIAQDLPNPDLVKVYTDFYLKIDAVYSDLIDQRITIGVANEERAMRIRYARSRWAKVMKHLKGA